MLRPIALALTLFAFAAFAGTPLPDGPHVVATGEGKVSAKPDLARISLSVEYRNAQPALAKQAVDRSINQLLAIAEKFAIAPEDVAASDLSLSEDVDYDSNDKRISNGFVASRKVEVKLRDLGRFSDFLDAGLAAGINEIQNISFESSRKEALLAEAREKAAADAAAKAKGLAAAFGAALGPIYSINSTGSRFDNAYGATALDRITVTGSRINQGRYVQPSVEYTEQVSTVFEIRR